MEVTFRRTGERRYSVIARPERWPAVTMGRGERLAREHIEELARSERLAAEVLRAWTTGARAGLEGVCAQLDELSARWSALGIGGTRTVDWPETAASRPHHPANGPGRRAAHRPRREGRNRV